MTLSIVMPVLDEAEGIATTLAALAPLVAAGHELVVVDGGSRDDTVGRARAALAAAGSGAGRARVITAPRGRARQMNAGAAVAGGEVLLFLHADTTLPPGAAGRVSAAVAAGAVWGRFDVRIAGRSPAFPLIGALINLRSRLSGIATGDQAIFVRRDLFSTLGGYAEQPLMEDVELSRRLKRVARPACLRPRATTSGRRWERHGVARTVWLMWTLRWRYWRGASAESLARLYR